MANAFFYTFSTIAQTLAAAIALLAAFLLYRFQGLNHEIDDNSMRLSLPLASVVGQKADFMHRRGQYRELLALAAETQFPVTTYQAKDERARLPVLLDLKDSLLCRFHVALYLTVGLITVSILALILTPSLADTSVAILILAVALVWFIGCMISYVNLLMKVFR
jgi:hypothetical protein